MIKVANLILLIILSPMVLAKHHIHYRISSVGNLVYQLDCITQPAIFPCSSADFSSLWTSELAPNEKDKIMLERWHTLRKRFDKTVEYVNPPKLELLTSPNFPMNSSNGINILNQVRIMAFTSEDIDHYISQLRLWLPINDVIEEQQIINHFWPRFESWFTQQQLTLNQFVIDAKKLSEEHDIDGLLTAMQTFYQSDLPDDLILPVYLVAHPRKVAATSGLVFNENSVVEVLNGEKASNRLAVVIHEIAHFYHERASFDILLNRMKYFFNENSEVGKIGYYLFNEAMATAIGNGLLEQRMRSPEQFKKYQQHPLSFYSDEGIDQAAKTALRLVSEQINNKRPIDIQFLAALDESWAKGLHKIKNRPQQLLRHMGLIITEESYIELINELMGTIRPSMAQFNTPNGDNTEEQSVTKQYPMMDTIILAKDWNQIKVIDIPEFDNSKSNNETGVFVHKTSAGVYYVFIVTPDKPTVLKHVKEMLEWPDFDAGHALKT
ncbi:MAG: hypothetical protein R3E90_11555 [Marinicella sp.]